MATWDARAWVAGLIGCDPSELRIRSTDTYGAIETHGAGTYRVRNLEVPETDEILY